MSANRLPVLYAERSTSDYTDPQRYDDELEAVFGTNWLIAVPITELPVRGALSRVVGGRGIVITRDGDEVRAFYNVCSHRAAEVVGSSCEGARMSCAYHGWTYGLDGTLVAVPGRKRFGDDLDLPSLGLRTVHAAGFGAFVWVNYQEDPPSVTDWLADYADELANYRSDEQRVFASRVDRVDLNWKAAVDAFNETYHVAHIHPQTVGRLVSGQKTWFTYAGLHSRGVIPVETTLSQAVGSLDADTPERSAVVAGKDLLPEQAHDHCNYTFFPNVIANLLARWGVVIEFEPVDVDTTELRTWMLADHADSEGREQSFEAQWAEFCKVLDEDISFLGSIGRGLHSRGTDRVRFGGEEERIVVFHTALTAMLTAHQEASRSHATDLS